MDARGWRQTDLARHAGIHRNVVNTTVKGLSFPSPGSLQRMARALGVQPTELSEAYVRHETLKDDAPYGMQVSSLEPEKAWLTINKRVSVDAAVKIIALVRDDDKE